MHPTAIYTKRNKTAKMNKLSSNPKYKLATLLRQKHGELNIRFAITQLTSYCQLKNTRTVADWLKIEAGSSSSINHLVLPKVLQYFSLQNESQLLTTEHKNLLKQKQIA